MDYQEVLNSQEIFGDELQMFAKKEMQKEVSTALNSINEKVHF
jgi:hypothetical protein